MLLFSSLLALLAQAWSVPPVLNYAGQVAVNGEAFNGNGLFKFALVNADGNVTYWSNDGTSVNGSEPQASVAVPVNGGLYSILLGNTAQQGMGAIDPAVFAQHTDAKLRVWFSDGVNGFQQLSPDRPFASVPYAFNSKSADTAQNAETAKTADSANVATTAMAVQAGAVTSSMLASNAVTSDKLSPQIKADINGTIGMNRLSAEVTDKLNQEKTTNNYNAPSVGSLLAVPYGSDAPAGYSLYKSGEPKELVWEVKAPVNKARAVYDGVEVLNGKIYFIGDQSDTGGNNTIERYDPETNLWETLNSANEARAGVASTVLDGKIYAIGGISLSSVEVYDPELDSWTFTTPLPGVVARGAAVTFENKIYLFGGHNENGSDLNQVLVFDNSNNEWSQVSTMPKALACFKAIIYEERIWLIGGANNMGNSNDNIARNYVRSYDVENNTWHSEASLPQDGFWRSAWSLNSSLIVAGGAINNNNVHKEIFRYNPNQKTWLSIGSLNEKIFAAGSVVFKSKLYLISGVNEGPPSYSNKVYAADLNASVDGIYDLYRKDGDAPVGTPVVQSEYADGSVTGSKMADGAITTDKLNEQILKYLKPEITSQPQAQKVYANSNVSFPVTAEGKYLTYQWKKNGVDLAGETNATLDITDANATNHDGNYSVVVSNDFGSVESDRNEFVVENDINKISGLVGWWKFDETNGTVAYDSSGNGRDGNLTNGPTWVNGKIGGALNFDGINDYVEITGYKGILDSNQRTICAWIKSDKNSTAIVSWGTGQNHKYWSFGISQEGLLRNSMWNGNIKGNQNIITNEWFHVASVFPEKQFNFGQTILFVNSVKESVSSLIGDDLIVQTKSYRDLKIGSEAWGSSWNIYDGFIDDVRIYDRALSAEEVQALYNLGQ